MSSVATAELTMDFATKSDRCGHCPRNHLESNLLPAVAREGMIDACIEERPPIIVFFWANATPWIGKAQQRGIKSVVQVGTVEEAKTAARAGADAIIAQGMEAGEHVQATVSLATKSSGNRAGCEPATRTGIGRHRHRTWPCGSSRTRRSGRFDGNTLRRHARGVCLTGIQTQDCFCPSPRHGVLQSLRRRIDLGLPDEVHIENVRYAFFAPGNDPTVWRSGWYPEVAQMQRATTVGLDRNGPNAVQSGVGRATSVDAWWAGGNAPLLVIQGLQDTVALPENGRLLKAEFGDRVIVDRDRLCRTCIIAGTARDRSHHRAGLPKESLSNPSVMTGYRR